MTARFEHEIQKKQDSEPESSKILNFYFEYAASFCSKKNSFKKNL